MSGEGVSDARGRMTVLFHFAAAANRAANILYRPGQRPLRSDLSGLELLVL